MLFRSISFPRLALVITAAAGLSLNGCSGGSSTDTAQTAGGCDPTSATAADNCGTVLVALTDAEGDFITYTVDVLSIALERADGTAIETLPATTRIDFAELTELAELVSAATLAPGDIAGGRIRIDYADAEIFVEAGGAIVPAEAVDSGGNALGIVDVTIDLDEHNRLIVTRGRTHLLQLDFDLKATHTVDTSVVPAIVTAEPVFIAEAEPMDEKALRVRGALIDVDTTAATYDLRVRPWFQRLGDHGVVTVETQPTTAFEIDGETYTGQAGIDALATQPAGTLTRAFGMLDLADRSFTAEIVHAGDSVGGQQMTAIHGNIVARSGDRLTVKGAIAVHRDRQAHFHRTVLVEVGPDTGVVRRADPASVLDRSALSVGQRIVAFGTLVNPTAADTDPLGPDVALVLDATAGRVRMLPTRLHGTVNGFVPGQADLTLRGIDRLGIEMFDFANTGTSPATDADPKNYEVATGTLAFDSLVVDEPVRAIGFVGAFGAAPPDFTANTIIGPADLRSALGIGWTPAGTGTPFSSMGPAALVPDLTNPDIGSRHHMLIGPVLIDLFDLPAAPSIEPGASRGLYGISEPGHVELFADFSVFSTELALRLGGGDRARSVSAYGRYGKSANTLSATRIHVHMLPAQ